MTDKRVKQRETKVMDVVYTNRPTHSVLRNYRAQKLTNSS